MQRNMVEQSFTNNKLLDKINVGIIYTNADGTLNYANKAAERILGLQLEDLTTLKSNKDGFLFIDYDGIEIPSDEFPTSIVLQNKKAVTDIIIGIHSIKHRHTTWLMIDAEPEFGEDGLTLSRVLTTLTNITSHITIEKKLHVQNKLQSLITKTAKTYLGVMHNQPEAAVQQSLKELGNFIQADRVYIVDYNFQQKNACNAYEWCNEGIASQKDDCQGMSLELMGEWLIEHTNGRSIHIPDVSALSDHHGMKQVLTKRRIQSILTVPILNGKDCIGFVGMDLVNKKHFFSEQEQNLLVIFAEMYANMMLRVAYNKQIQESELRLQKIVNSPTHYILRTDLSGKHTYWNQTFEDEFGWMYDSKGLEKGDSLKSICSYHHQRVQEVVFACLSNPGTVHQVELDKPAKNGSIKTTLWEFVCLTDANGKPSEMQCMGIDISAKRAAEAQVRKLSRAVDQIPLTVVITNLDGNIEYANPYTFQTTGYTQEELLGKNPKVLKSGETSLEEYEHLWGNITNGKEWKGIFHNRKKDGSLYWEQATIGPIMNEDGEITHYIAIKEDITERKRIQDELKDLNLHLEEKIKERTIDLENANLSLINANQLAQKANQAKIDFLSKMSHELRTPMNSILGFGQLLQMSELTATQEKGVQHILDSGKHLLNLINEVLDISRIESGRISISVEPVNVYEIINDVKESLLFSANQKGINIETELNVQSPIFIKADKQRLKQVLINLANNAIKYNNEGGEVTIYVTAKPIEENDYTPVRISVSDTGWGIEEQYLEKIFIPFERVGAERSGVEGTGLGLAVVKQLIEIMGGKVGVKSSPGAGSTFWVELQKCDNHLEMIQNDASLNLHEGNHVQSGTILYIEDNLPNIELVQDILKTKRNAIELVIHTVGNGALEKAIACKPSLILLDLNLPDKHGKDILVELQSNEFTKNIPVVVISADAMPNQIDYLMAAGAKNYLTKPIEINSFLHVVDAFVK